MPSRKDDHAGFGGAGHRHRQHADRGRRRLASIATGGPYTRSDEPIADWARSLHRRFDRTRALGCLAGLEGHGSTCQVVWSSGRDLDILPVGAGKGNAIRYLLDHLQLDPERVIVAGDSGNDVSMFDAFGRGIVVANPRPELLEHAAGRASDGIYVASLPFAAGVAEGLRHFGVL